MSAANTQFCADKTGKHFCINKTATREVDEFGHTLKCTTPTN